MNEVLGEEVVALQAIFEDQITVTEGRRDVDGESQPVVEVVYSQDELVLSFVCCSDYPHRLPTVSCPLLRRLGHMPELSELMTGLRGSEMLFQAIDFARSRVERSEPGVDTSPTYADPVLSTEVSEFSSEPTQRVEIFHGEPITDRHSVFQSHLAFVSSMDEVRSFRATILADKKFARATHNIFAYRFECSNTHVVFHDHDDDGETAAGGRLAELLRLMGVSGVAVVVSRWFGGVLLGADRFKLINNCARALLEQHGLGTSTKQGPISSSRAKRGGSGGK